MPFRILHIAAIVLPFGSSAFAQNLSFQVPPRAGEILEQYCLDCHGEDTQKGEIRLDQLKTLS